MILDNEDQRSILVEIINAVPIQGDYSGVSALIPKLTALLDAVKTAGVNQDVK